MVIQLDASSLQRENWHQGCKHPPSPMLHTSKTSSPSAVKLILKCPSLTGLLISSRDIAFKLLIIKDCTTVEDVLKECRRFEAAKSRRIAHKFERLPNTPSTSSCEDTDTTSTKITKIVRRELEAMMPSETVAPSSDLATNVVSISVVQSVVRKELDRLYDSSQRPWCLTPPEAHAHAADCCSLGSPAATPGFLPRRRRDPAEWRTPDNRPICFNCSRVGHVARYCRNNWSAQQRPFSAMNRRPYNGQFPSFSNRRNFQDDTLHAPSHNHRSPSPHRRQSLSPVPRRTSSPPFTSRRSEN